MHVCMLYYDTSLESPNSRERFRDLAVAFKYRKSLTLTISITIETREFHMRANVKKKNKTKFKRKGNLDGMWITVIVNQTSNTRSTRRGENLTPFFSDI